MPVQERRSCPSPLGVVTTGISAAAQTVLQSLGLLPKTGSLITAYSRCYMNNGADERAFFRGGRYSSSSAYGFASFGCHGPRSSQDADIGFRAAFVKLPTA